MTYLQSRLESLGLTPDQYTTELWFEVTDEQTQKSRVPIFGEDQNGNITILVYDLQRNVQTIPLTDSDTGQTLRQSANARHSKDYQIKRLSPDYLKEHPSMPKYLFPKGEPTYPFFPPALVETYESGKQIETLVLTEGYFKAMKAQSCGINCVGLGSITLFADKKTQQLYSDITRLINRLRPRNIVILYDGDCCDLSKDKLAEMEKGKIVDLGLRPMTFFTSMLKLRDLLKGFSSDLYFAYVNSPNLKANPKGLDDLLASPDYVQATQEIVEDCNAPYRPGPYFVKYNLSRQRNLRTIFHVESPKAFYEAHAAEIGGATFKFGGYSHHYNETQHELQSAIDDNLANFIFVSGTFYLKDRIPTARDDDGSWGLVPIADKAIRALYGKDACEKIIRNAFYKRFVNRPSHTEYQQNINGYYNLYDELSYKPETGTWEHIHNLLNHIFGPDGTDSYNMVLDYLTLLYLQPTQILPVICLVSKESGTGKTSFLNLLKYMFEGNCVIGGNDIITTNFNTALAGKLIVGIDETSLGENQNITEKIKMLATSETILMEAKGKDKIEMYNYSKFVLCSNNERKFIYTSKEEIRFWVTKVAPIPPEQALPNISKFLEDEVPAFVDFLTHREMWIKEPESRMWFAPKRLENEALQALKNAAMPMAERTLREYLHDIFLQSGKERLWFDLEYFRTQIPDFERKDTGIIRNLIEISLEAKKEKTPHRWKMPIFSKMQGTEGEVSWPTNAKVCRPYVFYAVNFLNTEEYKELLRNRPTTPDPSTEPQIDISTHTTDSQNTPPSLGTQASSPAADEPPADPEPLPF